MNRHLTAKKLESKNTLQNNAVDCGTDVGWGGGGGGEGGANMTNNTLHVCISLTQPV